MDGGGRLDQSLMRSGVLQMGDAGAHDGPARSCAFAAYRSYAARWRSRVARLPSGLGFAGAVLLISGALGYGVVKGGHVGDLIAWFKDARDVAANTVGFRIAAISLTGTK